MVSVFNAQRLQAATVVVGTCVTGVVTFPTIQLAVNSSPAGSLIKVCPGTYPEQVVINKKMTLTGVSSDGTVGSAAAGADNPKLVIPSGGFVANTASLTSGWPIAAQILVTSASPVHISSLIVDGSNNNLTGCSAPRLMGIYYQNSSGTVKYVVARNQAQDQNDFGCQDSANLAIFVQSGTPPSSALSSATTSTVTISNSSVHGFQKNGITGNEAGTTVTITGNSVIGAGPTATAQNGIQIGFGATGKVANNTVADVAYNGTAQAASGILIYAASNVTIFGNAVSDAQYGIATVSDLNYGYNADYSIITANRVSVAHLVDGIDVCSDFNTITWNTVFSADESGIHLDSTCTEMDSTPSGNHNTVSKNTIEEACAGILLGTGTSNTFPLPNSFHDVANTTLSGDVCTGMASPNALAKSTNQTAGPGVAPARP
jgi:hypothetical protein